MTSPRQFPVLSCDRKRLASIPWSVIAPHQRQALDNHYQSLERLAERGGLDLREMWSVLKDRAWTSAVEQMPIEDVLRDIKAMTQESTQCPRP